jgi:hypothetical protein
MKRLFLISIFFVAASVVVAGSLYVDDNAAGDPGPGDPLVSDSAEDGSTAHPFDAIQQAIDAATNGDEVIILPGTYTGDGNRDIDYKGKAITVRGSDPDDPNVVTATIIDCQGTEPEPHRGFYFHTGETESSILKGLTIRNGYGYTRVVFDTNPRPYSIGGGVFCHESSPKLEKVTITASKAELGGAFFSIKGDVRLISCAISNNNASISGGGVYFYDGDVLLEDCTISENIAQYNGGGISSKSNTITVARCPLIGNKGSRGGACYTYNCDITLEDSIIRANVATGVSGLLSSGGGIYLENSPWGVEFSNCVIAGNYSKANGGSIYVIGSEPDISNCTIVGNRADQRGGGIFSDNLADVSVSNSIVRGNSASAGSQMGYHPFPDDEFDDRRITVSWSNIQGGKEAVEGWGSTIWQDGNIDVAPLFAAPGGWDDKETPGDTSDDMWVEGDYHLKSYAGRWNPTEEEWANDEVHSPCIDAGDPAADYSAEPLYNGHRINIGAYGGTEYASKTANCPQHPTGDLNKDCKVTFADLAILAESWLDCNLEPAIACE